MYVVAIYRWPEDNPESLQTVAEALGMLLFEVRQRMAAGGPVVMASFADLQQAQGLQARLQQGGVPAVLVDTELLRSSFRAFSTRQFRLEDSTLLVATAAGEKEAVPYAEIKLILAATSAVGQIETTKTTTERKFSLGKTMLAGGLPMTSKVKRQTTQQSEERDETLCLYAVGRPPVLLRRGVLDYSGLGPAMQLSRELNFAGLKAELRRRAPHAVFDERLRNQAGQVRLLGTSLDPATHLDLAFEILRLTLV